MIRLLSTQQEIKLIWSHSKIKIFNEKRRVISTFEAQELADHHKLKYLETSAKTGHNVDMMFEMIATEIMAKITENKLDFTNDVIKY